MPSLEEGLRGGPCRYLGREAFLDSDDRREEVVMTDRGRGGNLEASQKRRGPQKTLLEAALVGKANPYYQRRLTGRKEEEAFPEADDRPVTGGELRGKRDLFQCQEKIFPSQWPVRGGSLPHPASHGECVSPFSVL